MNTDNKSHSAYNMHFNSKFFKAVLLCTALSLGAIAQPGRRPAPSLRNKPVSSARQQNALLPVDSAVIIGKLPNGLTYYIRHNTEPKNRAELYLVNKAGSLWETDEQQGLAHFTEHMAFNGTRDFPKNELVDYLQKSGIRFGADLNAYTSFDQTVFQLPLPTDSAALFKKGFTILANWAGYVTFDPAEINSERGVVLEEERLRGKNAQERLQQQILPVLLNNSRYAQRLPIGKEEILKNFKPETIKSFYRDWYRPDLQAVVAVGDFDPRQVQQLIRDNFSSLQNPAEEKPLRKYAVPAAAGTAVKIATDKEFPYTLAEIVVKHPQTKVRTAGEYLQSIRVNLFNQMINSRLGELTQKPNPPFLFAQASYGDFTGNLDAFTTIAVAKTAGDLKNAVQAAVAETERARKFGFTVTELERAKQASLTSIENAWKERNKTASAGFVREYQENFLEGEAIPGIDYEYSFYKANIGQIKLGEINALAGQFISNQNRTVIVEAPDKDKAQLPAEQTLLSWISAAGSSVKPYIDQVSNKPLLSSPPAGGKIIAEQRDSLIGTTTLTLSNGVKVILKPTDFKNDEIRINGFKFGGTSTASDADFQSDRLATQVIGFSGAGSFNQIQLDKLLAGKQVNVGAYIGDLSQGINGSASPKDLETALQLLYLRFTQPREDNDIWQSTIAQNKAFLANKGLDPGSVFQDTILKVLNNNNFRQMPAKLPDYNQVSLNKAYSFYKTLFADASDYTFIMVGSFKVDAVKPLLAKYLGGLPSGGGKGAFKVVESKTPAGQITKTVYKGIADKSSVRLVFSGDYNYNEANNLQMEALEEVLNIKLIERLREKESGVYSPGVSVSYNKLPFGWYKVTIYFSCAPANVNKLIAATMEEINKIKQSGAQPVDIQKFKAEQTRSTEVEMKENSFWSGLLYRSALYNENPDRVLTYLHNLDQVTVESTKATARQYLGNNLIKFILLPEKSTSAP